MQAFNIPIILTTIRLVVSPLILPFLCVWLLPYNNIVINSILAALFFLIGCTDLLDGYLARKFGQVTSFGAFLDPIADKFLIYSTLIALLAVDKIYFFWVILFIGREFFIMGLRLIALQRGILVNVSREAKWKTASQIMFLTFAIANPYQSIGLQSTWNSIEAILLFTSLFFTLYSAVQYTYQFYRSQYELL